MKSKTIRKKSTPKDKLILAKKPLSRKIISANRSKFIAALKNQQIIYGEDKIARIFFEKGLFFDFSAGEVLTTQGDEDNDIYFLISGEVKVEIKNREMARRKAGTHIGEMALIEPIQKRSATVIATEKTTVVKVSERVFTETAKTNPDLWRRLAAEVSRRLRERSRFIRNPNSKPRLFIGSSTEGLNQARSIFSYFESKRTLEAEVWTDGIFRASRTAIETLMACSQDYDFAVLIFTPDDVVISRGRKKDSPRDNILFEVGLFMGALGKERVFIFKPKGVDIRIPTDLLGLTCYQYSRRGPQFQKSIENECSKLLGEIRTSGPK